MERNKVIMQVTEESKLPLEVNQQGGGSLPTGQTPFRFSEDGVPTALVAGKGTPPAGAILKRGVHSRVITRSGSPTGSPR